MRVLFLLPESPYPPDSGPRHHTYGLLRAAAQEHECDVMGFYRGEDGAERWRLLQRCHPNIRIQHLVPEASGLIRSLHLGTNLLSLKPLVLRHYASSTFAAHLQRLVKGTDYDLVHVDQFKLAPYWSSCGDVPRLLVPYDAFSLAYYRAFKTDKSLGSKLEALYLYHAFSRLERDLYRHFTTVCPVSWVDAEWLQKRDPRLNVEVVGISVADEFFERAEPGESTSPDPHVICAGWLGADRVAQGTIQFLKESFPRIRQAVPDVRVTIWGSDPVPALQSLLREMPQIEHVTRVEDYIGMIKSAWVYVYPQACGAGIQTKVQQAMALGVPVVARIESLLPLYAGSGEHAYVCNSPEEMKEGVITLLRNADVRKQIGAAAIQHIRQRFSLEAIRTRLMKVYRQLGSKRI